MAADAAKRRWLGTYIGGLHSPPVSQPTAIHQDIQLVGKEDGWGRVRGEGEGRGSSQAGLSLGILMAQVLHLLSGSSVGDKDQASCDVSEFLLMSSSERKPVVPPNH